MHSLHFLDQTMIFSSSHLPRFETFICTHKLVAVAQHVPCWQTSTSLGVVLAALVPMSRLQCAATDWHSLLGLGDTLTLKSCFTLGVEKAQEALLIYFPPWTSWGAFSGTVLNHNEAPASLFSSSSVVSVEADLVTEPSFCISLGINSLGGGKIYHNMCPLIVWVSESLLYFHVAS